MNSRTATVRKAMSNNREFRQSRFQPPPGACEILLVRHGESAPHVEGESFPLVDGHGDPPAEWPALWQGEREPGGPEPGIRPNGRQVDMPNLVRCFRGNSRAIRNSRLA